MADLFINLRQLDFPRCALVALEELSTGFASLGAQGIPGFANQEELADQIVREFIFCDNENRSSYQILTAVQELHLLEILCHFFSTNSKDLSMQHHMFKVLFGAGLDARRKAVFFKLVSLAIGTECRKLLDCVAVWMQRHGCSKDMVTELAESVVKDYCLLVPSAGSSLGELTKVSRHFSCNLITAITAAYIPPGGKKLSSRKELPVELLEVLVVWIQSDPELCLSSLSSSSHTPSSRSGLWTSPTKPNTQTPIPGLVRWCTQAPLYTCTSSDKSEPSAHLWAKLHLAVLTTLKYFTGVPGANQLELITLADMNRTVKDALTLVHEVRRSYQGDSDAYVQISLDRLVQVIQVSLATGGFRCSLSDLREICNAIPQTKLLEIIKSQHLTHAPPPMHYEPR